MPTVGELSAPYANYLYRVRDVGTGVCEVCRTVVLDGYARCWQCNEAIRQLPATANAVAFIALAVKGEQLAHELSSYKNSSHPEARHRMTMGLAAVLWRWLAGHEQCLATAAGVASFDVVTVVPSTRGRTGGHPLRRIVAEVVGPTKVRYRDLLDPDLSVHQDRVPDMARWRAVRLGGESVLVIDDTWTTGSGIQSAAARLMDSGAAAVGIVAIGRHFSTVQTREDYRNASKEYYRLTRHIPWSWDWCCLH